MSQSNEDQIIRTVFQKIPKAYLRPIPYAFSLLMHSPTHQVEAETDTLYLDLFMVSPDDFLLQVAIEGVEQDHWLQGNMEQMKLWLDTLGAPTTDEMLWGWHMTVTNVRDQKEWEWLKNEPERSTPEPAYALLAPRDAR